MIQWICIIDWLSVLGWLWKRNTGDGKAVPLETGLFEFFAFHQRPVVAHLVADLSVLVIEALQLLNSYDYLVNFLRELLEQRFDIPFTINAVQRQHVLFEDH